jgi:enoyl-CoA hydratase/carnithine racemase
MPVHYEVNDHVAEILIEGIGPYNLFSPDAVYVPLTQAFERFRDDPDVWCALLYAPQDKDVFTYGGHIGSVDELKNKRDEVKESRGYKFSKIDRVFRPHDKTVDIQSWGHVLKFDGMKMYKPVVAAVHGPCIGAGTLLVNSVADYIVCSDTTQFGLTEMRWGIGGGGGGASIRWTLPWRIAMDMAMRGRMMEAAEALQYGFVNAVVARENVLDEAKVIAADFASMPPLALQTTKRLAVLGRETPYEAQRLIEDLFGALIGMGPDAQEGPRAFMEKRKPNFTGRL